MGNDKNKNTTSYLPVGMSIGCGLGVCIGALTGNTAAGLSIGIGFGLAVGGLVDYLNRREK